MNSPTTEQAATFNPTRSGVSSVTHFGVLGGGQMGRGIAQVAAQANLSVTLCDINEATAIGAKDQIAKALNRLVSKGKRTADEVDKILSHINPVGDIAAFSETQLVVEAVTEHEATKIKLFQQLDKVTAPGTILASNTSSISITRLGAATNRPSQVIGVHFMNPVPVMKLVEVIRGIATSEETYQVVLSLNEQLGKTSVTSSDYPGFIVNRILMPMLNEAIFALMEGVASAKDIDTAMTLGTNQPMGPLTLADFIGLDTCLAIMEVLHEGMGDGKYRPCPLLRKMVDAGRLGKKTGQGFFSY